MTIEEQTDTTNALVELNAPTIVLTASEMYIDADSVTLNAHTDITLNADSNISLNADSNIYLNANQYTSITGDSGVYIATPKLILDGALKMIGIDSATLYATSAANGTIRYCSDCTSNGITGKLMMYIAAMWRRLAFE